MRPLGRRTAVANCSIAKQTVLASVACAGVMLVHAAFAAVPVVESQGSVPGSASTSRSEPTSSAAEVRAYPAGGAATAYPASGDAQSYPVTSQAATSYAGGGGQPQAERAPTSELFYQLQTLQAEVGELRGLVEEQRHLIERLSREQKEQYLDLDRRVASLTKQGVVPSTPPAAVTGISSSPSPGVTADEPVASSGAPTAGERDAYTRAFNLTRDKRFQEAINAFNQLLVDYPNGEYAANSFYWLGELYLALPQAELEKSRQSFAQVVNSYPSHAKVPDSLYKLGVVYHRLGDNRKALEYLTRTHSEYPNSPAARLAQSYASEIR